MKVAQKEVQIGSEEHCELYDPAGIRSCGMNHIEIVSLDLVQFHMQISGEKCECDWKIGNSVANQRSYSLGVLQLSIIVFDLLLVWIVSGNVLQVVQFGNYLISFQFRLAEQ